MNHIGLDLGKSSIKYVTAAGPGEIPAWLARGRITQVMGNDNGTGLISYKEQDYIVGEDAVLGSGFSWSSTEDKDDPRNLIFALAILGKVGITEADVVIGLPVSAASSPAVVKRVKALLEGTHEVAIDNKPLTITMKVGVLPEPLGTFFSMALDESGRPVPSPYLDELVGIVDIGHRTVDVVILDSGKLSTTKDSSLSGITVLFDRVCKLIETDHGKLRPNEIAKARNWLVRSCQEPLMIGGRYVRPDMRLDVERHKSELAGRIMDEVQSLLANLRPDRVIMTGGGAALLRAELVKISPTLTFHPNPRLANAIGFYRSALARSRDHAEP
jgi:plasmid segregation protein ParM